MGVRVMEFLARPARLALKIEGSQVMVSLYCIPEG
jgi:hypothetical protein